MYQKASDPNRIKDLLMLCCQAFIELKNVQFWKKASNAAKDFKENNNSSLKRWNTNIYLLFILTFLVISKVCAWKGKTKISNDNEICISTAHKNSSFLSSCYGFIQIPSCPSHHRLLQTNFTWHSKVFLTWYNPNNVDNFCSDIFGNTGNWAGSRSKYANHCSMRHPTAGLFFFFYLLSFIKSWSFK